MSIYISQCIHYFPAVAVVPNIPGKHGSASGVGTATGTATQNYIEKKNTKDLEKTVPFNKIKILTLIATAKIEKTIVNFILFIKLMQ